jgi:cytochrome b pre-mRNA-processing protein 3
MVLSRLFKSKASLEEAAASLYRDVVAQARQPRFYADYGVPDSVDGRFELLGLHMFFVLHRLKAGDGAAAELAQVVFDTMFGDMDRSLREMGAGDLGVGKRVRAMAEGLYGRMAAYEAGLASADDETLAAALRRNLYGTVKEGELPDAALRGLCAYMRATVQHVGGQAQAQIAQGEITFPALPAL